MESLEQAIKGNQLDQISDDVHALKGICGNIGAEVLFNACHELETLIAGLKLTNEPINNKLQAIWPDFKASYEKLFLVIKNNLQQ